MSTPIERRTMRKVYLRLLPFSFALYLICYLDRANIGFAALTMNRTWASAPTSTASAPARSSGAISCSRCRAT